MFVAGDGDSIGFESLFTDSSKWSATVIEGLTVWYTARDNVLNLMEDAPWFAINVGRLLATYIGGMADRVVSLSSGSLNLRLVRQLLELSEAGERVGDGTRLSGVTHEFLSTCVGASREAVTIAMGKLKAVRAILQQGKGNLIVDTGVLRLLETNELNGTNQTRTRSTRQFRGSTDR